MDTAKSWVRSLVLALLIPVLTVWGTVKVLDSQVSNIARQVDQIRASVESLSVNSGRYADLIDRNVRDIANLQARIVELEKENGRLSRELVSVRTQLGR